MDTFYLSSKGEQIQSQRREAIAAERPTLRTAQDGAILSRLDRVGPEDYEDLVNYFLREDSDLFSTESSVRDTLRRMYEAGLLERSG